MSGLIGKITGATAAGKAAEQGAATAAAAQQAGLDYLKETEALPQQYRQAGLSQLAGIYGLGGGGYTAEQQAVLDEIEQLKQAAPGISAPGVGGRSIRGRGFGGGRLGGLRGRAAAPDTQIGIDNERLQELEAQAAGFQPMTEEDQQMQAMARLERSPIYQAIMSSADIGEESVLTRASQMGMTRSGDVSYDLTDYNAQLKQQALMGGLRGIQDMAQLPSMAPQIAEGISGIGQTLSQGQIARGQAKQEGMGMALSAGALAFSDSRLKANVVSKGKRNGHEWFSWEWNRLAKKLGLEGKGEGVIADKVEKYLPEAVKVHQGYKTVDYDMLEV
jgi:hypothetical protein